MSNYNKITALYSRLSVGDEDRDGGESNSIQNQKIFLENYAKGQHLTNIRHYIDDDESGRFFDRSAYSRMIEDVESGKIGVCIMKDLTRWGRDYLQVGNAMEIFRRNNVRFIAVNNGIDSEKPDTLEFAPFINIMSEWYAKDISKKVKTGMAEKMNCSNSSLRIFPQPGQPLFSVCLVQRKYPVLFGTWVAFKAYPQCPHLIFPASQVFFGFRPCWKVVFAISFFRHFSHVSEEMSASWGAITSIWSFKHLSLSSFTSRP